MDLGHYLAEDPTYGRAKWVWDLRPAGLPATDEGLDLVGGGDGFAMANEGDGAAKPDASKAAVVEEAARLGPPSVNEQVEALAETPLGMRVEVGRAVGSIDAGAASFAGGATVPPVGRAPGIAALVRVTDHGGEVAVTDARLAAAGVGAKAALGVVQVIERVAAEGADEVLA